MGSISLDLTNSTAWVTGGASGIGAAAAAMFRDAGARVISFDSGHTTDVFDGDVWIVALDVRDGARIGQVVERLVTLDRAPDILVNAAGINRDAVVWKLGDEDWQDVIDVNLTGAFRMTRACAPLFRQRRGGAIVNVSSINALRGKFGQSNYAASKAGLIGFTRAVATELGRDRIRVNAVAPGFVDTPMTQRLPRHVVDAAVAETVLGRMATPEEIAAGIVFLASPLATHITGHVLVIDGGQTL
jgi:NAD(P)-dependent dehydrogenase (short-subunit alcohol dehydrogenase family)